MTDVFYGNLSNQKNEIERSADILRVLAHSVRLQIVHQLIKKKTLNVKEIQQILKLPQSTISQHLIKMKRYKVVACERKKTEIFYRVNDVQVEQTVKILMG